MRTQLTLFFTSLLALTSGANADSDNFEVVPLFASNDLMNVTITAPFEEIMRVRSNEEELGGTLQYRDAEAGEVTLEINIRSRGRFRRQKDICNFTPLRLNFKKTKGTAFAKLDKQKLVTHCRTKSDKYEQAVLKEYLAYRILNTLTDWSFRVRLLRVKYVESTTGEEFTSSYAFLIEHRDQLAARIGMKVDSSERTTVGALDGTHTNLTSLYQYMIGNTDFSPVKGPPGEPCCHNYVLMGNNEGTTISVPYDFDVSGIVDPPHAVPNPRFKLASVRQRLYRGRCANSNQLPTTFATFNEKRNDIYNLVTTQQDLSKHEVKRTTKSLDDFYKIINSKRQVSFRIEKACI